MCERNLNENPKSFEEIVSGYSQLIKITQKELDNFKKDQLILQKEVAKALQENNVSPTICPTLESSDGKETAQEHIKLTNDAITNLRRQIKHLNEERDAIHILWKTSQDAIGNLEKEISNYRSQLLKPTSISEITTKYNDSIRVLENTIKALRRELNKQTELNKQLVESKQVLEKRLQVLEDSFKEQQKIVKEIDSLHNTIKNLKNRLEENIRVKNELENSLQMANEKISSRFVREEEALQKMQEALNIAEHAISQKEEALARETVVREECNDLAKTIGQVMEDAANKVDRNYEQIKAQHEQEIDTLKRSKQELEVLLENQNKIIHLAQIRATTLEEKLKEVVQENSVLEADLQVATQAIIEMELKIEAIEHLVGKERTLKKYYEHRDDELQMFWNNNNLLKQRWKAGVEEVTNKFKSEIRTLSKENTALKVENEELKRKLHMK